MFMRQREMLAICWNLKIIKLKKNIRKIQFYPLHGFSYTVSFSTKAFKMFKYLHKYKYKFDRRHFRLTKDLQSH